MKKDFVSLAEARPDLAKEWNYEKNGGLKPEDMSCGSNKKVWWKLPYDCWIFLQSLGLCIIRKCSILVICATCFCAAV